ncbi:MAG: hypothetical protein ACUVSX_04475 [Aggregatilineales bacterium]
MLLKIVQWIDIKRSEWDARSNCSENDNREAVTKAEANGNVSRTARELGISNKSLHVELFKKAIGIVSEAEKSGSR